MRIFEVLKFEMSTSWSKSLFAVPLISFFFANSTSLSKQKSVISQLVNCNAIFGSQTSVFHPYFQISLIVGLYRCFLPIDYNCSRRSAVRRPWEAMHLFSLFTLKKHFMNIIFFQDISHSSHKFDTFREGTWRILWIFSSSLSKSNCNATIYDNTFSSYPHFPFPAA